MAVNNYLCTTGFILLLVFSVQAQQGKQAAQQETPKAQSEVSPPARPVETPVQNSDVQKPEGPIQKAKASEDETDSSGQRVTRAEWMQIGINGLLFVVVLWQTLIYIQQRNIMGKQVAHAQTSERAYIGVKGTTWDYTLGAIPMLKITVLNGGRTPAYKVKLPGRLTIQDEAAFPDRAIKLGNVIGSTFMPAGAQATFRFPLTFALTIEWMHAIDTEARYLFFNGEVHFEDCWGNSQVTPIKLKYRATESVWADYKDPETTKPTVTVTP
jgi:hypothetical protein